VEIKRVMAILNQWNLLDRLSVHEFDQLNLQVGRQDPQNVRYIELCLDFKRLLVVLKIGLELLHQLSRNSWVFRLQIADLLKPLFVCLATFEKLSKLRSKVALNGGEEDDSD